MGRSLAKRNVMFTAWMVVLMIIGNCVGVSAAARVDGRSVVVKPTNVVDHMVITAKTAFFRPRAFLPTSLIPWSSNFVDADAAWIYCVYGQ